MVVVPFDPTFPFDPILIVVVVPFDPTFPFDPRRDTSFVLFLIRVLAVVVPVVLFPPKPINVVIGLM